MSTNYAAGYGYKSLTAAVIFTIAYIPLSPWFVFKAISDFTWIWITLHVFCSIRIAAFLIRAIEIGSDSEGENLTLLIVDQVLLLAGFFGLLYAAYSAVLDREQLLDLPPPSSTLARGFMRWRRTFFHLAGAGAVAIGIVAATQALSKDSDMPPDTIASLRKVSTLIFLILTIVQALQTLYLVQRERERSKSFSPADRSIGGVHGAYIFVAISVLMLIREIYFAATVSDQAKQRDENYWYPLGALPELLAVILFCAPGLVPGRKSLPKYEPHYQRPIEMNA
ncbi:hypothetical protein BDZ89DRAFT_1103805 [Hymenopellis radicata]|nr:hypothetical protein BDZ89DRAFT_1103805 [Hymenopellis radicata]